MPGMNETSRTGSTVLKTTTWGALITSNGILRTMTWGRRLALLTLITLLAAGLALADGNHKLSKDLDALKRDHNGAAGDGSIQCNQPPTAAQPQKVPNQREDL